MPLNNLQCLTNIIAILPNTNNYSVKVIEPDRWHVICLSKKYRNFIFALGKNILEIENLNDAFFFNTNNFF